jgi:hypothetical protein
MQNLLPKAAPAQVEAEARRYCEVLGKDGGYILGPAHLFRVLELRGAQVRSELRSIPLPAPASRP